MKISDLEDFDFKKYIENNKVGIAIYLVWVFINTAILLCSSGNRRCFYPFFKTPVYLESSNVLLSTYDFSEYFVYSIGPILGLIVFNLLKKDKE